MKLAIALAALSLVGCIPGAPIVPVTPANQAQIAACGSIVTVHNGVVVGDFVVGAGATGLASAAAVVNDVGTKNGLAVAGIITSAVGAVGVAIAGFTAADFVNSNCASVMGSLPAQHAEGK